MSSPEQVEAVADAIAQTAWGCEAGCVTHGQHAIIVSTAAIAAYEATRPVVSDEELANAYDSAVDRVFDESSPGIPDTQMVHMAGIRAVRERLEGVDRG